MSWSVAAEKVDGHSWQGNTDADQGVDGVTVERHHHQEDGEEAENDGEEQTELREAEKRKRRGLSHEKEVVRCIIYIKHILALNCWYLQWSLSVRLLPAQIQLSQNGQTHKEPVAEAVVVDKPEDIFHTQVYQGHDALQRHTRVSQIKKYDTHRGDWTDSNGRLTLKSRAGMGV